MPCHLLFRSDWDTLAVTPVEPTVGMSPAPSLEVRARATTSREHAAPAMLLCNQLGVVGEGGAPFECAHPMPWLLLGALTGYLKQLPKLPNCCRTRMPSALPTRPPTRRCATARSL